ncbi:MAG: hypothetical protein IPK04_07800 [Bdellovibrionales bacterium]|nr:hypothetical protein [Bdellovibrionales bacterium]
MIRQERRRIKRAMKQIRIVPCKDRLTSTTGIGLMVQTLMRSPVYPERLKHLPERVSHFCESIMGKKCPPAGFWILIPPTTFIMVKRLRMSLGTIRVSGLSSLSVPLAPWDFVIMCGSEVLLKFIAIPKLLCSKSQWKTFWC